MTPATSGRGGAGRGSNRSGGNHDDPPEPTGGQLNPYGDLDWISKVEKQVTGKKFDPPYPSKEQQAKAERHARAWSVAEQRREQERIDALNRRSFQDPHNDIIGPEPQKAIRTQADADAEVAASTQTSGGGIGKLLLDAVVVVIIVAACIWLLPKLLDYMAGY